MNILLTGVSRGLGLVTARLLLANGITVYGISKSESADLKKLSTEYPNHLKWLGYDLENPEGLRDKVFREWIGTETPLHGLVNNAAIAYDDIVTNLKMPDLEKIYRINLFSPMILTKYTIRQMLLHRVNGSVVHLSSVSVHTGYKGLAMYASTKGALEAFSRNTAREWGEKGIRSNCIVAGFMNTEMSATLKDSQKNRIYNRTALKKAVDTVSVAETIMFLLSEKSCSITGQNIHVDNGTI